MEEADPQYLKAKFQIGSCNGRVDYYDSERVFHPADVPQKAKDAKKWVKASVLSHKLETNPPWEQSTHTGTYYSAVRPAGWDNNKFEDRLYAKQETEERRKNEVAYKQKLITEPLDPRFVNPQWNQSTLTESRRVPATDVFFSQKEHRANDDSKSLRFGNESFIVPEPHHPPDGKMKTITGKTQLGTGLPYTSTLDMAQALDTKKGKATKLPIDYVSLVERHNRKASATRAEKEKQRAIEAARIPAYKVQTFGYPDEPNFSGTKRPDPKEVERQINEKYTADSLTQYLEQMDLQLSASSRPSSAKTQNMTLTSTQKMRQQAQPV